MPRSVQGCRQVGILLPLSRDCSNAPALSVHPLGLASETVLGLDAISQLTMGRRSGHTFLEKTQWVGMATPAIGTLAVL